MQGLDCKPSTAQKSIFRYMIELVQQNFWLSLSVSDIARFALRIVFSRLVLLRKNQKFRTEIFQLPERCICFSLLAISVSIRSGFSENVL